MFSGRVTRRIRIVSAAMVHTVMAMTLRSSVPIARSVGLFTTQIYGGVPQSRQVGALRKGVDIIVGTPGRIEDLHEQGKLDLAPLVTHNLPLERYGEGIALLEARKAIKVCYRPWETE